MLHHQQGGRVPQNEFFHLPSAEHINIVQRLVPYVEMRRHAQAPGQQKLLFLSLAQFAQVLIKVFPAHIHIAQNRFEQCFIQPISLDKIPHAAAQSLRLLRHIGHDQPGRKAHLAFQRPARAAQGSEYAALARAVGPGQRHAVPSADVKA